MQWAWWAKSVVVVLAGGLAGCSMVGLGSGEHPEVGSLGVTQNPDGGAPPTPAAEPVSMGGFLEGPVGSKLDQADRDAAFKAESQAVSTGERRTWRGSKGVYGFVVPAASGSGLPNQDPNASGGADVGGGECRTFTHTIYFAGRPQKGRGKGCQGADGTWRIVS